MDVDGRRRFSALYPKGSLRERCDRCACGRARPDWPIVSRAREQSLMVKGTPDGLRLRTEPNSRKALDFRVSFAHQDDGGPKIIGRR